GVAVNSTMAITTVLAFNVARERGGWRLPAALTFLMVFLAIDLGFLGSNLLKIPDGGWLPVATGLALFAIMTTWHRGSALLAEQISEVATSLETFIGRLVGDKVARVSGTGVFFTGRLEQAPPALQQLVRHTGVLYQRVVLVTVIIEQVSKVSQEERLELTELEQGFYRVIMHYGFMQTPNVPSELAYCAQLGLKLDLDDIHYIIGQVDMLAGRKQHGMAYWRDRLFVWMARNTEDATASYHIPFSQAMAVGLQIGI
ncbi:MAG: KUP/HAK/KT family potassium transporter, partial [Gammaproteobacteria bacterium]